MAVALQLDGQGAALGHRLERVEHQVAEHLLQLTAVAADRDALRGLGPTQLHTAFGDPLLEQIEQLGDHRRQDHRLLARFPVARELEQVVDDLGGAEGLPLHLLE